MKSKINGINLLPKEYIQAQKVKIYLLAAAMLVILECIVFISTVVIPPLNTINVQNTIINSLELQMGDSKYAEVNHTIQNLENEKIDIQKWVDKYQGIKKINFISAELFDELLSRVPQGFKIDSLQITQGQQIAKEWDISIKGKTIGSQAVYNYVTILETIYKGCEISWLVSEPEPENLYQTYDIAIQIQVAQLTEETLSQEVLNTATEGGLQ